MGALFISADVQMKIKQLTQDEFYSFFPKLMPQYFGDTMNFSVFDIRTQIEKDNTDRLKKSVNSKEHLYLAMYDDNQNLMGWSASCQARAFELYTMNSCVLPEHRRQGHYTTLVQETINEATRRGYQCVTSNHVISNNSVIIAKLKLGFKITGLEVFDDFGTVVKLIYYINETRQKAFDFRSGHKRPDQEIKDIMKM